MKKIFSFILLTIFLSLPLSIKALNLGTDDLLIFKNYTIKKSTTINEINNKFGQPKIITSTAFGGQAYSYYDDNYSYYLFLETDQNGTIRSYGAIGGSFKMSMYEEGDNVNNSYGYMTGIDISDSFSTPPHTYGAIQYNVTRDIMTAYWNTYANDSKYLYDLQAHGIAATKVMKSINGTIDRFTQDVISEDLFYINEQLKDRNSNLYDYASKVGKTAFFHHLGSSGSNLGNAYVPNPFLMASYAYKNSAANEYSYLFADFNVTSAANGKFSETCYYINPQMFDKRTTVALTSDEEAKLKNVQEQYKIYCSIADEQGGVISEANLFSEKPSYENLPLVAGKYNKFFLDYVTSYLNMARVGIGLRPLSLNLDIAKSAQYKAVLSSYNTAHGLDGGHDADKPEGLDDEFYDIAMQYAAENLYYGNPLISVSTALNDGDGESVTLGHRYNLLDPYYTEWGVGGVGSGISYNWQSAHKFSGYQMDDTELVAWPSNGIFVTNIIYPSIGNWSARFYKNYQITSETTVTVENLVTNKIYEINNNTTNKNRILRITNFGQESQVTFRDDNITYENGDVFKITLHNVKNLSTGENQDYSYRSVFYSTNDFNKKSVDEIIVDREEVILGIGESYKLSVQTSPIDATIEVLNFASSNAGIATVRQDGLITANKTGIATITIKSANVSKTITVRVKDENDNIPYYLPGDLNQNGVVDMPDVYIALKLALNHIEPTDEQNQIGDINNTGNVDMADTYYILKISLNIA